MTQVLLYANAKQGYHFEKWTNANGEELFNQDVYPVTVVENTGYIAVFAPNTNTKYVINHFKQNLDGSYPSTPTDTDTLYGTSDAVIEPAVKTTYE